MKKIVILIAALFLLLPAGFAQQREDLRRQYEEFKQNRRKEYQDFKAQANAEFAAFLKQAWKDYKPRAAAEVPIPVVMPEPQRLPEDKPSAPLPDVKPDLDAVRKIVDAPAPVSERPATPIKPIPAKPDVPRTGVELAVQFYGDALLIPWNKGMSPHLSSVDETGFSAAWTSMSEAGDDETLKYLTGYADAHGLNGWGYYQLARKVSEQAYAADLANERIAMQAWLLSQMKFKAQVAACGDQLVLLLPFKEQVYGIPYLTIGSDRYYIYSYGKTGNTGYRTYENKFAYADRRLSLAMDGTMDVGLKTRMEIPRWSELLGEKLVVLTGVGNIALLLDYPLIDGVEYYRQRVPAELSDAVLGAVRRKIAGMNETDAVGYLLNLVQNGFSYATDESVFGRQKQLFVEESFFYGQNNCKDRVGVFSWLVRELTGLDLIFVRYEGNAASGGISHITCAVCFKGNVSGDAFNYKGRRYVMCDPTYINAGIGRTMPCYADSEGIILTL